jgi:hypothetical protein
VDSVVAVDSAAAVVLAAADDAGKQNQEKTHMKRYIILAVLTLGVIAPSRAATVDTHGKAFPTASAAAQALVDAAKADNTSELIAILGPSSKDIISTRDPVEDRKVRRAFVARASQKIKVVPSHGRPNEMMLLAGNDNWSLPIPIVQMDGKWYFDMARGRKEILVRRVGSNELDAIELCRGYVEAQNQFAEQHRTDAGVPYYAQKIISTPGERDGLYWEGESQEQSPIGAIIAKAISEGYTNKSKPYHGYYFRVLKGERQHASGKPVSYVDNGVMTRGFALIAWPAQYGSTGIMTFLVNRSGIVYQKNLGRQTPTLAAPLNDYDPDTTWVPVSTGVALLKR